MCGRKRSISYCSSSLYHGIILENHYRVLEIVGLCVCCVINNLNAMAVFYEIIK